ncbi:transposable element Tcb2 transposase [Trichonephila clavipes]|uniref:Transposable element Tcb2 transposase n=1 Tax=Trichonephila clavipes TaxID=2585209 RepID=A0A8X6VVI9_TRICX|nr:transposable element Tcb2 transposase [Trichonephila clavipes]
MYVVDHTLPYLILRLPELSTLNLTIDCSHLQMKQNGNIVNKINKYKNERKYFLHINEETYVTPPHSQISKDQNVLPQIVIKNRCQLRVEPQRIILKSDLPAHLRPYRTSPIQEKEIKAHHPQTNGKNERVNQSLVTRLKCKVNASSTKIPWTKLLDQVCNEYDSTPHSITKYPPAYLLFGPLPYQSPIDQNNYYEPVDEACELALQRKIDYHIKNKITYDARCIEKNSTQSTTSCAKHRRMSKRGETDSHSIGSSDKFHATAVRRNVVNHQTRRLNHAGLYARRPAVCIPLTSAHKRSRLNWSFKHQHWSVGEWANVMFSNESRFSLSSDSRRVTIWRERGTRFEPRNITERHHFPSRGVMVWAGMMMDSRTDLHFFDTGSVTAQKNRDEVLEPYVHLFRGAVGPEFIFLDDNAPCYRAVLSDDFLETENIQRMPWSVNSPDLIPIEHV